VLPGLNGDFHSHTGAYLYNDSESLIMEEAHGETELTPASALTTLLRQRWRPGFIEQAGNTTSAFKLPQTPSVKAASRLPLLLPYHDIPAWCQDNEYILHGYRPGTDSATECFASCFYVHNETFNIFSHLVSAVCSLFCGALLCQFFLVRWPNATTRDQVVFVFFLFIAVVCLLTSSIYHTLMNPSALVS